MTPTGLEHCVETQGKTSKSNSLPPQSPPSDAIELLAIWAKLDEPARRDLLAVARGVDPKAIELDAWRPSGTPGG